MASTHDFSIDQGATWNATLQWLDDADDPIDLTSFTARMQLRRHIGSPTAEIELTTANGRITITALTGTIMLSIDADDTADLNGSYVYDLELINGSAVTRLLKGSVTVDPEVTK